ncbi:MAG: PhzF family phenazine biosynthesis protein, partial [Candidatus Heimdallarchaeota archaeon]
MELKIYTVDSFTNEPFKGNPAGVCLLENALFNYELQNIASEMNLSETAFILPLTEKKLFGDMFSLRWFTPTTEVDLCGHATLASAHILFSEIQNRSPNIIFETKSGTLIVERSNDFLTMNFPIDHSERIEIIPEILDSLNLDESIIKQFSLSKTQRYLTIELENEAAVKNINPDFQKLNSYRKIPLGGVIVTSRSDAFKTYDFTSRFFTPWYGIDEDPVTGSSHTVLASYWQKLLDKNTFKARQLSKRGGELDLEIKTPERVLIKGKAITIL